MDSKATWLMRYCHWIERKRIWVLLTLFVITLAAGMALIDLKINASPYFLGPDHPARQAEYNFRRHFTNSAEQVFVAYIDQKNGIFTTENLRAVQQLGETLSNINFLDADQESQLRSLAPKNTAANSILGRILDNGLGQEDTGYLLQLINSGNTFDLKAAELEFLRKLLLDIEPVINVNSLFHTDDVSISADDITVSSLISEIPTSSSELRQLQQKVTNNPIFLHSLVSPDGSATSLQLELRIPEDDSMRMQKLHNKLTAIAQQNWGEAELHFSGPPVITAQIVQTIQNDNLLFTPLVSLVIGTILLLSFRRWQAVILPMAVSSLTTLWTYGLMAKLGIEVNIVTTSLPVFLMTIAVADSIHFLNEYYQRNEYSTPEAAATLTLTRLFSPLLMTSITTLLGFVALANTNLIFVRHFGLFTAAGVLFAFLITVTLLPCALPFINGRQRNHPQPRPTKFQASALAANAYTYLAAKPKLTFCGVTLIVLMSAYNLKDLKVDNNNINDFAQSTKLHQDDTIINQYFGGSIPLNIWFTADDPRYFTQPEAIEALEALSQWLRSQPEIGYLVSPADLIKRMDQQLNQQEYQLSEKLSAELISQYYFLYESSEAMQIRDVLNGNYSSARILALSHTEQASIMKDIVDQAQTKARELFPDSVEIHFAGFSHIMVAATQEVVLGQIKSLLGAVLLVTLVMALLFRSVVIAMVGTLPLILTILLNFAIMSVVGFSIDIATALIAGIVFGIGIDYAIHFLASLKHALKSEQNLNEALFYTVHRLSRPIIVNSLSLSLGFGVMIASSYGATSRLGMLVAMTMTLCALLTLLLLPLLIRWTKPKALQEINKPVPPVNSQPNGLRSATLPEHAENSSATTHDKCS